MSSLADLFVAYKPISESDTDLPFSIESNQQDDVLQNDYSSKLNQAIQRYNRLMANQAVTSLPEENDTDEDEEDENKTYTVNIDDWYGLNKSTHTDFRVGTPVKYNRGKLADEVRALFKKEGINIHVTSGRRRAGIGTAGKRSHHIYGNAVDIVPGSGETFASVRQKMLSNPRIRKFFADNMLGVIDETDPAMRRKTGATGDHFHIGPDKLATTTWNQWLSANPNNQRRKRSDFNVLVQQGKRGFKVLASDIFGNNNLERARYIAKDNDFVPQLYGVIDYEEEPKPTETYYHNEVFEIPKTEQEVLPIDAPRIFLTPYDEYISVKENSKKTDRDRMVAWTRMMYNTYLDALRDEYRDMYDDDQYKKIAKYMTAQSANESGWGEKAHDFNYGGHRHQVFDKHGNPVKDKDGNDVYEYNKYNSMDEYLKAHLKTLSKWHFMDADTFRDYIDLIIPKDKDMPHYFTIKGIKDPIVWANTYYGRLLPLVEMADNYLYRK